MGKDMKLKTIDGKHLSGNFTDYEIRALKMALDKMEGDIFFYGRGENKNEIFVEKNDENSIKIVISGKSIEAKKINDDAEDDKNEEKRVNNKDNAENINRLSAAILEALNNTNKCTQAVDYQAIFNYIDEKISANNVVKIKVNNEEPKKVDGILHKSFNDAYFWALQRVPIYLYGEAGTGKNILAQQIAEAMELDFYYAGSLQFKSDLEGFVDAAGNYVETDFYKAFTKGGVFLLDEIDGTSAEVLVAFGAALANRYYNFPKYGKLKAHEDFVIVAAGNTKGRGANEAYNGRYQLDASTLDRFAFINMEYDERIELQACGGDKELLNFFHNLRGCVKYSSLTYTVSPRAMQRVYMCVSAGVDFKKAINQGLTSSWDNDDIKMIFNQLNKENKYSKML